MTTTSTLPNVGAKGVNPLKALLEFGQSPWMDYVRRDLLTSGGLKKMIQEDGLMGMTSNPTIFEKAITGSKDYADILESPEAKKLNAKGVGRENVMIKVPGTKEGLPAIRQLLEEGININITLLFAQSAYEAVAEAFLAALEARVKKGQDISHVASVASFFVSRIDTLIDSQIDEKLKTEKDAAKRDLLSSVEGKVAIANAKLTYKKYQELFGGARWKALAAKGAQVQRLLWASTSTKNKKYRDVMYVEELIGADTVDTIPPATFDAFRDHGKLRNSLTENVEEAAKVMSNLEKAGISMKEVTEKLVVDGVKLFADAFRELLDA